MSDVDQAIRLLTASQQAAPKLRGASVNAVRAAKLAERDELESAIHWCDEAIRRSRRGLSKVERARALLGGGEIEVGLVWRWPIPQLPWTPEDFDDALQLHVPAPSGIVSRSELRIVVSGRPDDVDATNLLYWFTARQKSGAGQNRNMLASGLWSLGRAIERQGIGTMHGPPPAVKTPKGWVGKSKIIGKQAAFGDPEVAFEIHVVADYDSGEHFLEWDGVKYEGSGSAGDLIFPTGKLDVDVHGLLLSLGGIPTADTEESSAIGVLFNSGDVTVVYRP